MSVIGSSCLILLQSNNQLRPAIIRAATQPIYKNSDFSQIKVLLEWCDGEGGREWGDLTNSDKFQAVYLEHCLLWAKRILPSERQRAVAWPAKAFTLLCGTVPHPPESIIVEYFCDQERTQLYIQETKELVLAEAKLTLSQHSQMLQELSQFEELSRNRELLTLGGASLRGCRVSVCNVQQMMSWITGVVTSHNLQTRELTVVEDHTRTPHTVNPLMVHVLLQGIGDEVGGGGGRRGSLQQSLLDSTTNHHHQQQQMWPPPLSLSGSTDLNHDPIINGPATLNSPHHAMNSPATLNSPHHAMNSPISLNGHHHAMNSPISLNSPHHLSSPILHDCQSPSYSLKGNKAFNIHRTPSIDLHRRSSLQCANSNLMKSEPNLHRRCSLEPLVLPCGVNLDSTSLNRAPLHIQSPPGNMLPPTSSPRGSSTQLNKVGLNDPHFPNFSPPELYQQERSRSVDNIQLFLQQQQQQQQQQRQKRRATFGVLPGISGLRTAMKKPRFDVSALPPILQEPLPHRNPLSRSVSQPIVFPPRFLKQQLGSKFTPGGNSSGEASNQEHEDELDMIEQIINKDQSIDNSPGSLPLHDHLRSHSLTNIPSEFSDISTSMPVLPHAESIPVLHSNYYSAPDFSQLRSPPSYDSLTATPSKTSPQMGILSHENRSGSLTDFSAEHLGDQVASFIPQDHRNSAFEGHTLPPTTFSTQSTPNTMNYVEGQPPNFDFTHRRESNQSSTTNYSDLESRTPVFEFGRGSAPSANIPDSFQFPSPPPNSTISSQQPALPMSAVGELLSSTSVGTVQSNHTTLMSDHVISSPTPITRIENPSLRITVGYSDQTHRSKDLLQSVGVTPEAEVLSPIKEHLDTIQELEELAISRVVNQHVSKEEEEGDLEDMMGGSDDGMLGLQSLEGSLSPPENKKPRAKIATQKDKGGTPRRGRGRPRLTEEEKQRRKELRDLGLMKRSKRRTKEEVAQWRAEKILTPAKRGRKPGSGKKNIIKAASGKVVYVTVDLSQYPNGTVLAQNGFCRAYPGVTKCMDCSSCEGDLPQTRYCRFLEFRKLRIVDNSVPVIEVEGFADYSDVSAEDLVPWTPLKAGYSGMDESSAKFVLSRVIPHFIAIVTEEAHTLPEEEVTPIWKRAVRGIREMCDTCATALFNFHWVCRNCGFCICPACYCQSCGSDKGVEAVSSMHTSWPVCVANNQPHRPSGLILAQIIPANVLSDVVSQVLRICEVYRINVNHPRILQKLISSLSRQQPLSHFQNDNRKSKTVKQRQNQLQQLPQQMLESSFFHSPSPSPLPSSLHTLDDMVSLELPHSCSNGSEDQLETTPIGAPHLWLCEETLLCLLDSGHEDNLSAFQERWKRGDPVVVAGVHRQLSKDLWTPESFERDFGDEPAELVDCKLGMLQAVVQAPCRTFWAGFEDLRVRLRDPATEQPRLLKLKDWPPGDDFSEKLPKRFADLMDGLPCPEYTRRGGKLNITTSLPNFFVKPDLGPKMYNAYGSPAYPSSGTTNLHLDISDAVNVMVYCGIPPSVEEEERRMIEEVVARECCPETLRRVRETGAQVGAMWHIYAASDADKIRALLRKVLLERGWQQPTGSDPIHDQMMYLDSDLRLRLYNEYGVRGWAIAQCVGDAIFIPAGAPHQVRNLCSCIKVAEDFVSPEHVSECLKLTEEFRQLSDRHANHEDKLQVKNIIYHSMKDTVGILKSSIK